MATTTVGGPPKMPKRKWWQHLPFANQGFNDKLADYQNQYNQWMWNKQNEYNTPQSQMDRYRDASLNPNLMYGQGTPGNAEQGKPAERPEDANSTGQIAQAMNLVLDGKMKASQIRNVDSQTALNRVGAALKQDEQESKYFNIRDYEKEIAAGNYGSNEMYKQYQNMLRAASDAKNAAERAKLTEKANKWFVATALSSIAGMGLGNISRFIGVVR